MTSYSTGIVPSCGYCGKPVITAAVYHLGVSYHPECTRGWSPVGDVFDIRDARQRIADLERQLAEKTSEAKDMRSHYEWALAEIEAMRPMVKILTEAVSKARPKRNVDWYVTNIRMFDVVYVRNYMDRKQP